MTNKFVPFNYEEVLQRVIDYFGFLPKWFPNITSENQEHFLKSFYTLQFLHNFAMENYGDYNVVLIGGTAMQLNSPSAGNIRFSQDIDLSTIEESNNNNNFVILNNAFEALLNINPNWVVNFKQEQNNDITKSLWRWEVRAGSPNTRNFKSPMIKVECSKQPTLGNQKELTQTDHFFKVATPVGLILNKMITIDCRTRIRDYDDLLFFSKMWSDDWLKTKTLSSPIIKNFISIDFPSKPMDSDKVNKIMELQKEVASCSKNPKIKR